MVRSSLEGVLERMSGGVLRGKRGFGWLGDFAGEGVFMGYVGIFRAGGSFGKRDFDFGIVEDI